MKIYHIPAAPPLYTNTFLLVGENGLAAAVDPAAGAQEYLRLLEQEGARLTHILLTHGHYDHVGAVEELQRKTGAEGRLAPQAAAAKVAIGIENVWNRFLLSPLETARFLDEIGSPWVGMYLDVGNVVYLGYPEQWVELLAKHIKKLHMSDYRFDQAGIGAFVDLFAGDVDFPAVAKAIAAIGYDDYITLEMLPNYKQFPEVSLYADKYAMDKIAQMVREAR